jgi:hypothetical protein
MNTPAVWLTDDRCPGCDTQLIATSIDACVTQECHSCGWAVTWAPEAAGGER